MSARKVSRERQRRLHDRTETMLLSGQRDQMLLKAMALCKGEWPDKNPIRQRAELLSVLRWMIDYVVKLSEINTALRSAALLEAPNAGLPWTQEEDHVLVEWRAADRSLQSIANDLGRTPGACATRLSVLIGMPREEVVERYLNGTLDDQPVRGVFRGRINTTH